MNRAAWRAFLCSSVLFLLACVALDYSAQPYSLARFVFKGLELVIEFAYGGAEGSGWSGLGVMLFIASLSVAAGGAMRWWRENMDGETDVKAAILDIGGGAAGSADEVEETQDAAREEVAALPAAGLTPEDAPAFAHFDERGRSPLERVLADW